MSSPWLHSAPSCCSLVPHSWILAGQIVERLLSDAVSYTEGQLFTWGVAEAVSKVCHHVNSHTIMTKMFTMTDYMDALFPVGGKVIVYD